VPNKTELAKSRQSIDVGALSGPPPSTKADFDVCPRGASAVNASEKCSIITYSKSTTSFQRAKDELHTLPLSPTKGGSETLLRCFTNITDSFDKTLLLSFSALKLSDKSLILPLMPP